MALGFVAVVGVRRLTAGDPAGGGEPRRQFRHRGAGGDRRADRLARSARRPPPAPPWRELPQARPLRAVPGRRVPGVHRARLALAAGGAQRRRARRDAARHRRRRRSGRSRPPVAGVLAVLRPRRGAGRRLRAQSRRRRRCAGPMRCCSSPSPVRRVGYTWSAQLSRRLPAREVISWVVVLALPISAPLSFAWRPADLGAVAPRRLGEPRLSRRDERCISAFSPGTPAWRSAAWRESARSSLLQPFLTFAIAGGAAGRTNRRRDGDLRRSRSSRSSSPAGGRASAPRSRRRRARNDWQGPERIRAAPKSGPSQGERPKGHCDDRRDLSPTPDPRSP